MRTETTHNLVRPDAGEFGAGAHRTAAEAAALPSISTHHSGFKFSADSADERRLKMKQSFAAKEHKRTPEEESLRSLRSFAAKKSWRRQNQICGNLRHLRMKNPGLKKFYKTVTIRAGGFGRINP